MRLATTRVIAESQHETAEERVFWLAVRRMVDGGDELAVTALGPEADGTGLLQKIGKGDAGTEEFEQAMSEFDTAAREHIEFEESRVWPPLRGAANGQQLAAIGEHLNMAKRTAPTRPHPHTPSTTGVQETLGAAVSAVDRARDVVTGRKKDAP
ncbi:hemerythrin domain-containing protein [Tomitella cavernea]|uniref:Hemerythrin domain-containing protein n=1 Tax=Tomitella cavernea TaxID=1387982 RepID=A0ABP9CSL7_9ACTN